MIENREHVKTDVVYKTGDFKPWALRESFYQQ